MNKIKNIKKVMSFVVVMSLISVLFIGCSQEEEAKTVRIGMVNWSDGIAISNLTKVVMEDRLGYEVELTMGDVGPIYASVASGDYDAFLDGWLPSTHADYIERFGDDLNQYSTIFEGTRNGLVVPAYVEIDSIEQLDEIADQIDGKITGIDSGAGIMGQAENAITEYDLDLELQTGSGPVMTAALADAIGSNEAIVVTGWQPHWKFGEWDLKFLDDPKGVFGEPEAIKSVTRVGMEDDLPEFAAFLDNFSLSVDQMGGLMAQINASDEDPEVVAREWAEANSDIVDGWVAGIE